MKKKNTLTYIDDFDNLSPVLPKDVMDRSYPVDFSIADLLDNNWKVFKCMNELDVQVFKEKLKNNDACHRKVTYNGKHLKPLRDSLNQRLRDIRIAKREQRRIDEEHAKHQRNEDRYAMFLETLNEGLNNLIGSVQDYIDRNIEEGSAEHERKLKAATRVIGNTIHDLPVNETGLYSLNAYAAKIGLSDDAIVAEHYRPRSRSGGEDIFLHCLTMMRMEKEYTLKEFFPAICSACQINKTTQEENRKYLEPYQKRETFSTPEQSYRDAGLLPLVRYEDPKIHHFWKRCAKELNRPVPEFEEFPEITTDEADTKLKKTR